MGYSPPGERQTFRAGGGGRVWKQNRHQLTGEMLTITKQVSARNRMIKLPFSIAPRFRASYETKVGFILTEN